MKLMKKISEKKLLNSDKESEKGKEDEEEIEYIY